MMALHSLNPPPPHLQIRGYEVFKILNNGGLKNFNINGWVRHNGVGGWGRSKNGGGRVVHSKAILVPQKTLNKTSNLPHFL